MSEEPRREIILTRSHIRLGRRVRINKDFPSRASSWTGEYFKHPSTLPLLLATHSLSLSLSRSPFLVLASYIFLLRLSSSHSFLSLLPLLARRLFAFLLSRREKHFLSTASARGVSRTQAVNFSSPFYPIREKTSSSLPPAFAVPSSLALSHLRSFVRSFACTLSTSFSPTCRASMNT